MSSAVCLHSAVEWATWRWLWPDSSWRRRWWITATSAATSPRWLVQVCCLLWTWTAMV